MKIFLWIFITNDFLEFFFSKREFLDFSKKKKSRLFAKVISGPFFYLIKPFSRLKKKFLDFIFIL